MIYLGFIIFITAGILEGMMDVIQFHYPTSKFSTLSNPQFYNPELSWRNKYKNNDPSMGEKFLGSTTIFVGLTDAWHLFKTIRTFMLFFGIIIIITFPFFLSYVLNVIICRILFGISFTFAYNFLSN